MELERLVKGCRGRLFRFAFFRLGSREEAEDVVQEAFLRLAKNFSKIEQVNCPRTRLFTVIIVRNISLTMLAERKKETVLESPDAVIPIEYDLEEDVLERIAYEEVLNAIRELPVLYRDVLYLQCVEEYKLTEISRLLGIEAETVKKRAQRGRKKLLDQLTKEHENDDA